MNDYMLECEYCKTFFYNTPNGVVNRTWHLIVFHADKVNKTLETRRFRN